MDIEGTYTLQATPDEVWQCLRDSQTLLRTVPGLERVERQDEHSATFDMHIKHAPLRGHYQGRAIVEPSQFPLFYRMTIDCEGMQSKIQGAWDIRLNPHQENTVVNYHGTLNLGRVGSLLPPTLVKGALKALIQQFFAALAEQLRTTTQVVFIPDLAEEPGEHWISPDSSEAATPASTLAQRFVHLVGLGHHDAAQEALWVARLRRMGAIAALLLLVWIGTRLPRRLLFHE